MSAGPGVTYLEMHGRIDGLERGRAPGADIVVLSNLERGGAVCGPRSGLCLRFVARGRESYRIDGRGMHLDEAQVMIAPQHVKEEVEIPKRDRNGTLGLCVLLAPEPDELSWVCGPLVASASCTPIGPLMQRYAKALSNPMANKQEIAAALARAVRSAMPSVAHSVLGQVAALAAAKPSTRYEMMRRAYLAQAYLHSVLDRAVPLDELAKAVARSPSQLLRAFHRCFGETPADYHRRLRLNAVIEESKRRKIPITGVSQEFGFPDGSSFSHAYRRAFGRAPVWTKAARI